MEMYGGRRRGEEGADGKETNGASAWCEVVMCRGGGGGEKGSGGGGE